MLNLHDIAAKAASEFGLSMLDDPTLWPVETEITPEQVREACNTTAQENARSALSRALGKIAEAVATDMDVEIAEDGALADLGGVLALHVEDADKLDIDLSGIVAAEDWDARVEATRSAFAYVVQSWQIAPLPIIDLLKYGNDEPRFNDDLRKAIAALRGPEHEKLDVPASLLVNDGGTDWDEPEVQDEPDAADPWTDEEAAPAARERGKPAPGRKRRTKAEIAEDEAADRAEIKPGAICSQDDADKAVADIVGGEWDDNELAGEPAPDAGWDDEPVVATAPNLPGLVNAAGIADVEMANVLGIGKGYYSLLRNGKRPWPGMKPDQVQRLRREIAARREALDALEAALTTDVVLKPEGL